MICVVGPGSVVARLVGGGGVLLHPLTPLLANGKDQQLAALRLSTPQGVSARLLHRVVRRPGAV
jgi:hypothetical protein